VKGYGYVPSSSLGLRANFNKLKALALEMGVQSAFRPMKGRDHFQGIFDFFMCKNDSIICVPILSCQAYITSIFIAYKTSRACGRRGGAFTLVTSPSLAPPHAAGECELAPSSMVAWVGQRFD